MVTIKSRLWMIVGILYSTVGVTWLMASLSEWLFWPGYVRWVALVLFAGASLIGSGGLIWFLANALIETWRFAERNRDLVAVGEHDHVFVRSQGQTEFVKLGEVSVNFIRAKRTRGVPLEEAGLSSELYNQLVRERTRNDRKNGD